MLGKIKKLTDKGFGFISQEGGRDIFFHAKGLRGVYFSDLRDGDDVEFDIEDSEKGPRAVNVVVV